MILDESKKKTGKLVMQTDADSLWACYRPCLVYGCLKSAGALISAAFHSIP